MVVPPRRAAAWSWYASADEVTATPLATAATEVTATFTLTRRPGHMCDGTGESAVAVFRVSDGKITLWHQLPAAPAASQTA